MKNKVALSVIAVLSSMSLYSNADVLPQEVTWLSNNSEPVFASEEAKRGGTLRTFIQSFPQTLRSV
ncbi:MAG: ABC transporter substrate-binding protein, partial [Vibrio gallaecicus]